MRTYRLVKTRDKRGYNREIEVGKPCCELPRVGDYTTGTTTHERAQQLYHQVVERECAVGEVDLENVWKRNKL